MSRRQAKVSLISFTQYTFAQYEAAEHHRLIAEKLEAVERGDIDRLMIFMPPRYGKSEITSRRFPAWYLGRNHSGLIIATSYSSDLADDFGRDVRDIVASQEYRNVFEEVSLRRDSKAAGRWNTDKGGAYLAAGVCKGITGRGANILLIDDPVKDRQEADSETTRESVWKWYRSTAYTRLMPGGAIILIQTRWHEDDLAGRLIAAQKEGGDQWDILSLPAIDQQGQALWPEWYPIKELERIKFVIGSREWQALYQQRPSPETGDYFKREWIKWYDKAPSSLSIYGASDYAVTANGGDYTVHGVCGIDQHDNIYLLDWWREQTDSATWINAFIGLANRWRPIEWGEENGQIIKSLGPFIDKKIEESRVYVYRKQYASTADKASRAQSIRGRMAQGKVYFPSGREWADCLVSEMMSFPVGKHDDQIDVLSLFGRMLGEMAEASPIKQTKAVDDYDPYTGEINPRAMAEVEYDYFGG